MKNAKNQVVMTKTEISRAKTATTATTARRSSKPKRSTAKMVEAMEPASVSRRVFYIAQKSDLYARTTEPTYIVINGVPHKRVDGKYVALTAKPSNPELESLMYQQLVKLAGLK